MISKEKLLKKIQEVIKAKNNVIPLLDRHISASLTFSGLGASTVQTIREKCQSWMFLQQKHVKILKEIAEDLQERKNDVF